MRGFALLLCLAVAKPLPDLHYFQFVRPVTAPVSGGQSCLSIDPIVFVHAEPTLADVRLYREGEEVPYAVRTEEWVQSTESSIQPLNLGVRDGKTVFDAVMPRGPYNEVTLAISVRDFWAQVAVTGSNIPAD